MKSINEYFVNESTKEEISENLIIAFGSCKNVKELSELLSNIEQGIFDGMTILENQPELLAYLEKWAKAHKLA